MVASLLNGAGHGNMQGRSVRFHIRNLLQLEWTVRIVHVYREANMVVDGLASLACDLSDEMQCFGDPPASILHLLHAGYSGVFTPRLVFV